MAVVTLVAAMAMLPTAPRGHGIPPTILRGDGIPPTILRGDGIPPTILRGDDSSPMPITHRRRRRQAAAELLSTFFVALQSPATAFNNGIEDMEQYKTRVKYSGTQPALGVQANDKLATCDYAPNCFSTTGDESHLLPLWKAKAGSNAMAELLEVVKAYPPFQARIDGGGFSIITASADYVYIQFESLKNGFIDDVEFFVKDGKVQVRSSSRTGFLDLGVNAKRLNWISARLRDKGWTAPAITKDEYPEYFALMPFSYDDYIRSVLSPSTCANPGLPLECKGKAGVIP